MAIKYIVNEIQTYANGQVGTLTYSFDTPNEADNKYYTVLASAAISTLPCHAVIQYTEQGFPLRYDHYEHEQPNEPQGEGESENPAEVEEEETPE